MPSTKATRGNGGVKSSVRPHRSIPGCRGVCSTTPATMLLGQLHDVVVVGVGLVELQHGEFRIVGPVHPFVPEVVPDLVDPLEAADQQPLEVQLVGDPQVERHVERVVVGDERPRRGAAVEGLEHRRLDLEKAALVEEAAEPA